MNNKITQYAISFLIANLDDEMVEDLNCNFDKKFNAEQWEELLEKYLVRDCATLFEVQP
jgi:hypothetical protein